jgi:peroxiredoxin-like protein
MSQETHDFVVNSTWKGDADGDGLMTVTGRECAFGRPECLGGAPGRTNPEELLISAVVSCYAITLALLFEKRRLAIAKFEVGGTGTIIREENGRLKFTSMELRPRVELDAADEKTVASIHDMAQKAEDYCLVSAALHGNVEITVKPEVLVLTLA